MDLNLKGKRVLVTGGSKGIGRACAEAFAAEGAEVRIASRNPPADAKFVSKAVDLSQRGAPEALADWAGELDILVNCAGIPGTAGPLDVGPAEWRRVLAVVLDAPVFLMQIVGRGMAQRGSGRIVNITSVHASHGSVGTVAYDVAKAGLENATRSFGIELAPKGVAVNAIAPGFVRTRLADLDADWFRVQYVETGRLPARRGAEPREIAAHVAWLASADAAYVSGAVLTVDGGLTATF